MDAFYASVEQRDRPELRGKPIAVGGRGRRGVLTTASYEARPFGIGSAMPTFEALRRCPDLIVVPPRFEVYQQVSQHVRTIFERYTDLIEPLSLDEAYLDVTHPKTGPPSATLVAQQIRADIQRETGLTASAGVGPGKFIAKVASSANKPDGLTVVTPAEAQAFVAALPVERFHGVGPVTSARLHALGLRTGADLLGRTQDEMERHLGKTGRWLWRIARADDPREVRPHRIRKSVGAESTFEHNIGDPFEMEARLLRTAERVSERMARHGVRGRTVTLKIKYADFTLHTRAHTGSDLLQAADALHAEAVLLLRSAPLPRPVRLLGLSVSALVHPGQEGAVQLRLRLDDAPASGSVRL
jgi:DNA polymerase-4